MELRNPIGRARGLGSARGGSSHWLAQRVTAIALALLSPWLLWAALGLSTGDYADARSFLAQPANAALMATFMLCLFYHAQLGIQVVVEDYVHTRWLEILLQIATKFACFLAAIASVLAIVRIALGA
jgi:succinate dehydrogenase / fumarate reductase, membrane anchor subunit